jgi:DNA polymerase-1
MANTLLLVDAYATIYRAFYAIRSLNGPQGEPVNAIFGFTKMLRKLLADHHPTHAAVVFDLGAPQHRLDILPSYKEQRPPTPPALDAQLPAIREMLAAMRLPIVEIDGEEADDIIATLAVRAASQLADVLIASQDKDFMQLVSPRIRLIRAGDKETGLVDADAVHARYGVEPAQIVDLLCLVGDAVDNIPGVPGIGEKTAAELLRQHKTLDHLLAAASGIDKPKLREALLASAGKLRTNRQLIALRSGLDLPVALDDLRVQPPDYAKLAGLFTRCGFRSLLAEIQKEADRTPDLFERL